MTIQTCLDGKMCFLVSLKGCTRQDANPWSQQIALPQLFH